MMKHRRVAFPTAALLLVALVGARRLHVREVEVVVRPPSRGACVQGSTFRDPGVGFGARPRGMMTPSVARGAKLNPARS
ncbi:hypothetical protein T484DRAFT_2421278 [Baffinella frigidus]|nr:hypothetical protein T484DRAFT_2421278 [Cryptophyta sp. CCMP2293]